jgi:N-acetylneuraminate synthase
VLQCTTAYPCPEEKIGLNLLPFFRERYRCDVGLSDHSGKIYPGLAAVTLGARVLEVHVTFSRECFGPDVPASLTTAELAQLVEGVRLIEKALRNPVDKDEAAAGLEPLRGIFTKSVAARIDLPAGAVLSMANLTLKKPGTGIPADRLRDLIGRTLCRPVRAGDFLSEADFEEPVVSPAVA